MALINSLRRTCVVSHTCGGVDNQETLGDCWRHWETARHLATGRNVGNCRRHKERGRDTGKLPETLGADDIAGDTIGNWETAGDTRDSGHQIETL